MAELMKGQWRFLDGVQSLLATNGLVIGGKLSIGAARCVMMKGGEGAKWSGFWINDQPLVHPPIGEHTWVCAKILWYGSY